MKMVIRADDVGYTHVHNIGTFEAVDNGLVTSCDVMLDTPGTVEALEFLRDRPWISTGWHTHFWGAPVLDPAEVPTMYDASIGHFRRDLGDAEDVSYEECLKEMRAQMDRCIRIMGRVPDVIVGREGETPFRRAMTQTIREHGIVTNFTYGMDFLRLIRYNELVYSAEPAERWKEKKIYMTVPIPGSSNREVFHTDSIKVQRGYDPLKMWTEDEMGMHLMPEGAIPVMILHPGYVDDYVCREGSQTPAAWNYLTTRAIEVRVLCSKELKDWVRENRVELVNFRDALYDTCSYQNHLRAVGSDLYMK